MSRGGPGTTGHDRPTPGHKQIRGRHINIMAPVVFRFPGTRVPNARHVAVVGSFNGWNSLVHPLGKTTGGNWTITIYLPPGRAVYHFFVHGAPWLNPHDEGRIPNGWGSEYSVRYIR